MKRWCLWTDLEPKGQLNTITDQLSHATNLPSKSIVHRIRHRADAKSAPAWMYVLPIHEPLLALVMGFTPSTMATYPQDKRAQGVSNFHAFGHFALRVAWAYTLGCISYCKFISECVCGCFSIHRYVQEKHTLHTHHAGPGPETRERDTPLCNGSSKQH